jgi:hypothetical protein
MTKKNENHYAGKHGQDLKMNPDLAEMIKKKTAEGKLPCAVAFKISEEMDVPPADVGAALDLLEIKISKCQMGIFGYGRDNKFVKPMKDVPGPLERAIRESLRDKKLACGDAWQVAERSGISRMDIASACDSLGIKISPCQLGAF